MTRRSGVLRRHYTKLTVFERLQLALTALARRDLDHLRALDQTCPGADHDPYLTRLFTLQYAASLLVVQLLAHAVLLAHSPARRTRPPPTPPPSPLSEPPCPSDPLPRSDPPPPAGQAPPLPDRIPAPPDDPDADQPGADRPTAIFHRQAALWRAFVAWCGELGHDPHQVLLMAPLIPDERDPAFRLIQTQIETFENLPNAAEPPDASDPYPNLFKTTFTPP
jgi:hypothetical protein